LGDRLQRLNRPIRVNDDDIDDLLTYRYGERQSFLVLSLLYPWIDYKNLFHLDHVHPRSIFTTKSLKKAGVPESDIEFCLEHYDDLPNVQILATNPNQEKSNKPLADWITSAYPAKKARAEYCERQFIPDVDLGISNFREFFKARSALMRDQLNKLLKA
jgi:hypothetical protein